MKTTDSNKESASKQETQKGTTKAKSNAASGLTELFEDGLKDIYWAEKALTKAIPLMAKNATSADLIEALNSHLTETEDQIIRLEKVFELIGKKATAKKCDAMEGLSKEGEGIIESTDEGTATRDVGIILASQKVEHYEIATYGGLVQLASTLNLTDVAEILAKTLEEEKLADQLLTEVAENDVNYKASEEA